MAGLFGLFGKKSENTESGAFYLDSDDAKTFGNVEFMRKQQEVKKSFPKMSGGQPFKVSDSMTKAAMEMSKPASNGNASTPSSSSSSSFSAPTPSTERRRPDTKMDEFLKMARDMKK
ncbi:hypothetical protein VB834_12670 [Limnoraphis robusta Tam1]|jgi:hypothetical protein|uniref:hypothetical protein n=1 Tax=Limnoraphis robusta TaxID=1118279 RepID=UPI002B1FC8B3|nr:hypothetical protein [Limnoraphis robusta]MEA5500091.1 hypothetical protein [Limnoraphis robusta BA-68 BA1]MEA5539885.1 hypothetical protein [Limnoraphis robusta Tam1]